MRLGLDGSELGDEQRLDNELIAQSNNPEPARKIALDSADSEARVLYERAVKAWLEAG
jgi:hypothetical protein